MTETVVQSCFGNNGIDGRSQSSNPTRLGAGEPHAYITPATLVHGSTWPVALAHPDRTMSWWRRRRWLKLNEAASPPPGSVAGATRSFDGPEPQPRGSHAFHWLFRLSVAPKLGEAWS